jgi:omega-6 fatty acid desaturase (delta-12 desaturase)
MFIIYGIPYLYVNHWLVFITYLQHTDPALPHYTAEKWTFARGALATIDRTFMGFVGGWILHGICETHVAHHTSSKIPHYNAWEATEALKNFLGPHYQRSEENMFVSFYKAHRDCVVRHLYFCLKSANQQFVEDNQGVVFFKNARGVAQKYAVEEGGNISDSGVELEPEFKDE